MAEQSHLRAIVTPNGAVILSIREGTLSTLNSTGADVWKALERGESIDTVAEQLARNSGEPIERVKEDVNAFAESLKAQGIFPR